jgi:lipopolysaccharide transport system ATP-binding protein
MSNNDIAIKVENLSKYYRLGVINNGTFFKDMQTWWARKLGKEDPHARLGTRYNGTEGFWALDNLNFEIKKGDRVGIIGHNGAGKSTLLKILSQITTPTKGTAKINGKVASLLEVGTGFHHDMTGRENIYMNGSILGMSHSEIDKKIKNIIDFSEINEHIDTPVKRYSSGMSVRLAFAVAAHLDSNILIADEVLAVGDASFQRKALGKMNELSTGQGRTVLFVSHNMSQITALCNRGIVLEQGKIAYMGDIKSATKYYLSESKTGKKIIDFKEEHNPIFHVTSISVNGMESCDITIPCNTREIPIVIEGTTEVEHMVDVMVILKTITGAVFATFSIGHYEGITQTVLPGKFTLRYIMELPKYMGRGECIASICVHHPGLEGFVDFYDAIKFTFEGNMGNGHTLDATRNGILGLTGYFKK